jgi:predicted transcriptional regulator of viral defense system
MAHLSEPYYAGLLTAAEHHGAAHQRPQVFQVLTPTPRRPLICGRTRVHFIMRENTAAVPTVDVRTPRGVLRVSTPEATALDVIAYPHHAAGIDNAATVVAELAEQIEPQRLADTAALMAELPVCQRLGYILDYVGAPATSERLRAYVAGAARRAVPLVPSEPHEGCLVDPDWRVVVNARLDPDL